MAVLSTDRISTGLGLGVVGLGTAAVVFYLRHRSSKESCDDDSEEESQQGTTGPANQPKPVDNEPKLKSRIGNFKISKLKRLMQAVAGADDVDGEVEEFDWEKGASGCKQSGDNGAAEHVIDGDNETEWEKMVASEERTFSSAAQILREVRGSATHKKVPHFYVVDRQLSQMVAQFDEVTEHVMEFPWREHRDEPIAALMKLPFMKLIADVDQQSLLPLSSGFVKQTANGSDDIQDEDTKLLGIDATASREELESAFRYKARDMHRHGQCTNLEAFHKLNNAYDRWRARLAPESGWRKAYQGGSTDVLAHYLLIGTDPSESRYGEAVSGLLDALERERLLNRLDVLRSWGEVSGTATGLGNG